MEVAQQQPKREWPKWLYGPDGMKARFDSPGDVPRDYAEAPPAHRPAAHAPAAIEYPNPSADLRAMVREEVRAELARIQAEKMEKARAGRKPKA